jgi:formyl-CoA transferase
MAQNKARVSNMDDVDAIVVAFTKENEKAHLAQMLQDSRVPAAPVRDLPEVMQDKVLHERGALIEVDHPAFGPITLPRSAIRFDNTPQADYTCSPEYAQDNARIYGQLGFDAEALKALTEKGVI